MHKLRRSRLAKAQADLIKEADRIDGQEADEQEERQQKLDSHQHVDAQLHEKNDGSEDPSPRQFQPLNDRTEFKKQSSPSNHSNGPVSLSDPEDHDLVPLAFEDTGSSDGMLIDRLARQVHRRANEVLSAGQDFSEPSE